MKKCFFCLIFLNFISLNIFAQTFNEVELKRIEENVTEIMSEYITQANFVGDVSAYDYATREQSFGDALKKIFVSSTDQTICYNDLDPTGQTGLFHSPNEYVSHILLWYKKGVIMRFLNEKHQISAAKPFGNGYYVSVFNKKEISGEYISGAKFYRKQYDLEFVLSFKRQNRVVSNFKIAAIKVKISQNENVIAQDKESAEAIYAKSKIFYENKEYEKAFVLVKQAAELGLSNAQNKLAYMYEFAYGTQKNYDEAFKWYKKAADQENEVAQSNLGFMYENGYGVRKSYTEAFNWYLKAAKKGNAVAQSSVGYFYENGYAVEKSYAEAIYWYRKSAEQGNAIAQSNVGMFYENGFAVDRNYTESAKWYRKAAEQGNTVAQGSLAYLYWYGKGVEQNYDEAFIWYQKAAEKGYDIAESNLGKMYENGFGVEPNDFEAVKWYKKAAEKGNVIAQANLAFMYQNGKGTRKDLDKAIEFYQKAAKQGNKFAQDKLKALGLTW